ncbi:T9SS type A sorting domain-containing protein [Bacteroidota bacterium]
MKTFIMGFFVLVLIIIFNEIAEAEYPPGPTFTHGCMSIKDWKLYNDQDEILYSSTVSDCNLRSNPTDSISLESGKTYRFEIYGLCFNGIYCDYGMFLRIWIDWNANESFNDSDEMIFSDFKDDYDYGMLTGYFTVPVSSNSLTFRMRAAARWNNYGAPSNTGSHNGYGDFGDIILSVNDLNLLVQNLEKLEYCAGEKLDIPFETEYSFNSGNDFIAQLSDKYGSFANPLPLDTLTGTISDTMINVLLPKALPGGTGYRIRVVSTDPPFTGEDNGEDITINELPNPLITQGPDSVCYNSIESYLSNTNNNVDYKWFAVGGQITGNDNDSTVTVNWMETSSGTITLIQTNTISGCTDSTFKIINMFPLPEPEITGPDTVCSLHPVTYSGNIDDNDILNKWLLSAGEIIGSDSDENVQIIFNSAGTATLKLIQTNTVIGCKDSTECNITIFETPESVIFGDTNTCGDAILNYNSNYNPDINYIWQVTGGTIITEEDESISVQWDSTGSGKVSLIQTNINTTCSDTSELEVHIYEIPKPEITGLSKVCFGSKEYYTCNYNSDYQNTWVIEGGKIISEDVVEITIIWDTAGIGKIKLIQVNSLAACSDSTVMDVVIHENPVAEILECPNPVYENQEEMYISKNDSTCNIFWSIWGGDITNGQNTDTIHVWWGKSGKGEIKLIIINEETGCSDTLIIDINIIPEPDIYILGSDEVCEQEEYLYRTSKKPNIENKWHATGGEIIGSDVDSTVQIKWDSAGIGIIKLIKTNTEDGFKDSLEKEITIHPLPEITFNELPDICLKAQPLILNHASPKGGDYTGPGIRSNIFYPQDVDTGSHKITYTFKSEYGCENSASQFITVLPAPDKPIITQSGRRLKSSSLEGNQWFIGGNEIPGANNQYYAPDTSGYYTVQVTDTNGCKSDLSEPYYFDITAVDESDVKKQTLRIYPNPATNQLFIEYYVDTSGNVSLVLYDILGNKVTLIENRYKLEGMFTLQINIDDFSSGLYYLVYQLNNKTSISKISVIK